MAMKMITTVRIQKNTPEDESANKGNPSQLIRPPMNEGTKIANKPSTMALEAVANIFILNYLILTRVAP